jgi:Flp pilus assembly pilin Flp
LDESKGRAKIGMTSLRLFLAYLRAVLGENSDGQGFVEYLMIIGLIALGLAAALVAFQGQISTALSTVGAGV